MSLRILSVVVSVCVGLGLSSLSLSCSRGAHSEPSTPEEIAQTLVDAVKKQDEAAFSALLTTKAREGFASGGSFSLENASLESADIGTASVDGDEATVPVTFVQDGETKEMAFKMRRENGSWRLFGFEVDFGDQSMTIDFERIGKMAESMAKGMGDELAKQMKASFEKAQREQREREIQERKTTYEGLHALDEAEFDSSWRVGRSLSDESRLDAVRSLVEELGFDLDAREHAARLEEEVGEDLSELSRLAAIDRICAAVGLVAEYPSLEPTNGRNGDAKLTSVRLALRPADFRHAFTGPFEVRVGEVRETAPYARGKIILKTQAHGVDEALLGLLDQSSTSSTSIDHAKSVAGESLLENENTRYFGGGYQEGRSFSDSLSVELRRLLRCVDHVASFRGTRRISLPLAVETVELDSLKTGATKTVGDLKFTVRQVGKSTSISVTGPKGSLRDVITFGRALDAKGDEVKVEYEGLSAGSTEGRYQLHTETVPSRILVKLVTKRKTIDLPFEISDIPLRKFADQPERLEALSFGNFVAPASLRFKGFVEHENGQFPEAKLDVVNHSNKPIQTLQVRFVYVDARGKKLGDHPHTVQGTFTAAGWVELVKAKGRVENVLTALFRPENTKGMKPELMSVAFMDGTSWTKK